MTNVAVVRPIWRAGSSSRLGSSTKPGVKSCAVSSPLACDAHQTHVPERERARRVDDAQHRRDEVEASAGPPRVPSQQKQDDEEHGEGYDSRCQGQPRRSTWTYAEM